MSSDKIQLDVEKRELTGKKVSALRKEGFVPAVIYGADFTPMNIQAPANKIQKVVEEAGTHAPVEIMLSGKPQMAIIKTIDIDPAKNSLQHVAFQAVSGDQVVTTDVPVAIVDEDESEAKKAGLVILQSIESLEIKAKPADLPSELTVSATTLKEHGDRLTVADINLPAGVELADEDDAQQTIATVYEPSALAAANAEDEKEASEGDDSAEENSDAEATSEETEKEAE